MTGGPLRERPRGTYNKPAGGGLARACAVAVVRPTATALAPFGLNGLGRSRPPAVHGCGPILGQPTLFLL